MALISGSQPKPGSAGILEQLNGGSTTTKPSTSTAQLGQSFTGSEPQYDANGQLITYIGVPSGYVASRRYVSSNPPARLDSLDPAVTNQGPRYLSGAELELQKWSTADIARLQIEMVEAGLLGKKEKIRFQVADDATIAAYKELLGYANLHGLTQIEAMDELKSNPLTTAADGFGAGGGPSTTHHTRTDTIHFDDLDARAMANDAYAARTGRAAKGKEAEALQDALNAYASAHPAVTTSTVTDDGSGNTDTVANTTGGFSAAAQGQVALDQAQAAPDYAEFQAAGVYMPLLERALGASSDVRGR